MAFLTDYFSALDNLACTVRTSYNGLVKVKNMPRITNIPL